MNGLTSCMYAVGHPEPTPIAAIPRAMAAPVPISASATRRFMNASSLERYKASTSCPMVSYPLPCSSRDRFCMICFWDRLLLLLVSDSSPVAIPFCPREEWLASSQEAFELRTGVSSSALSSTSKGSRGL